MPDRNMPPLRYHAMTGVIVHGPIGCVGLAA